MLSTLGTKPERLPTLRAKVVIRARWINSPPRPHSPEEIVLGPGVWIVRAVIHAPRWLPPSVFDTASDLPSASETTPPRINTNTWKLRGLCAKLSLACSTPMFFGAEEREDPRVLVSAANEARAICAQCPIRRMCLTSALENDERYGVWGGTSGRQRKVMQDRIIDGAQVEDLVEEWFDGDEASQEDSCEEAAGQEGEGS